MILNLAFAVSTLSTVCDARLDEAVLSLEKINGRFDVLVVEKYKDPVSDFYQARVQSAQAPGGAPEEGAYYLRLKNNDPVDCQIFFIEKFL